MYTNFFFYKHMKDPYMISQISPFYQTKNGQVNIKNYNCLKDELEIDSNEQKNNYKLNGKIISFNLNLQDCLQKLNYLNLESHNKKKKYYVDRISAFSIDDQQYYQTYIIY